MTKEWRPFCDAWLAAWTGNEPDGLLQYYTEGAYYSDPAYPDGLCGHAQIAPYFAKLLSRNPDWKWEAVEIMNTEKGFTLKWRATIPVREQPLIIHGLDIVEMSGDLISRNEVYFDRVPWMEMINT
ncbi:MAG: nuclear transport factor 2 family protein [Bacteroidetes bacterium]|nr:nuclear transport factor 2 family protein [Bacteroidota bacterium]